MLSAGPSKLSPKRPRDSPTLPAASHQVELPEDRVDEPDDTETMEFRRAMGYNAASVSGIEPAEVQQQQELQKPTARQRRENGTVGGHIQPPSPYSEEGSRAAREHLTEVRMALQGASIHLICHCASYQYQCGQLQWLAVCILARVKQAQGRRATALIMSTPSAIHGRRVCYSSTA